MHGTESDNNEGRSSHSDHALSNYSIHTWLSLNCTFPPASLHPRHYDLIKLDLDTENPVEKIQEYR